MLGAPVEVERAIARGEKDGYTLAFNGTTDRLTARLPMLRPPPREAGMGAIRVEVRGRDVTGWSTAQAIAAGVGMGFQPPKWLQAGDRYRIEIDGLGAIDNLFDYA